MKNKSLKTNKNSRRTIRKRRRPNYRLRKVVLVFVLALIIFIPLSLKLNVFAIDKITIKGNNITDNQTILKRASLEKGQSLLSINKSNLLREVEKIPYVDQAKISYNFPNKITVSVTERTPLAQIFYNDKYYLVDRDLRVLDNTEEFSHELVKVSGINMENIALGDTLYPNEVDNSRRDFMEKLLNNSLYNSIKSVEVLEDGVTMLTKDNIRIVFGAFKDIDYKLKFLTSTLATISQENKSVSMILMEKSENPILVLDNETRESEDNTVEN